jgi:DNA repair protein RadD
MTAPVLRPYQTDFVAEFDRTVAAGTRRILGVAPTGGGKTVIFAEIIRCFVSRYKPVLVLTHRREIIGQTSKKLGDLDIPHGIIMAGRHRGRSKPCRLRQSRPCTGAPFMPRQCRCRRPTCW